MTSFFVGSYVNDITLALKASVVSQEHCLVISPPGWGKTDIELSAGHKCLGKNNGLVFIRFAASSPPQKVEGVFDPQAALGNPARFVLVRKNTVFDPDAKIVIADEFTRPSDPVFDILIDALNRKDIPQKDAPVFWGTANFATTSARSEALRDRIGLIPWIRPGVIDVRAVVDAHAHSMYEELEIGDFPTWKEVLEVRNADPGDHAIEVCKEILELLAQEAAKAGLAVNPRRATQWFNILFHINVLLTGKADFDSLEGDACKCLTWAWANTDETKAAEWQKIASCVVDIIGTAISELKGKTLDKVRMLMSKTGSNAPRAKLAVELGEIIQDGQKELEQLGSKDKRIKQALEELESVFVRIARGEDPFANN